MSRCIGCGHLDCSSLWPLRRKCCPDCSHGRKPRRKARFRAPVNDSALPAPLPPATGRSGNKSAWQGRSGESKESEGLRLTPGEKSAEFREHLGTSDVEPWEPRPPDFVAALCDSERGPELPNVSRKRPKTLGEPQR